MRDPHELGEIGAVLRNLREGDVVWFKCHDGVSPQEASEFREAMQDALDPGVTILITEPAFFKDIMSVPLGDILVLRDMLNRAIKEKTENGIPVD